MQQCSQDRGSGECGKSYEYRSNLPFCGSSWNGCGASDAGLQQSIVSPCDPGQHGKTDGICKIQEMGFKTAAMALREDSVDIDDPKLLSEEKLAIVLGTEGDGLATETIADCDYTVCIPMAHGVDSLNVAAASAVAFWQLGR